MTAGQKPVDAQVLEVLLAHWGRAWRTVDRWPLACPACGQVGRLQQRTNTGRYRYHCVNCTVSFTAHPAEDLPCPRVALPLWVVAAYLLTQGASVRQLQVLPISYKPALVIARFVRGRAGLSKRRVRQLSSANVLALLRDASRTDLFRSPALMRVTTLIFWDIASIDVDTTGSTGGALFSARVATDAV